MSAYSVQVYPVGCIVTFSCCQHFQNLSCHVLDYSPIVEGQLPFSLSNNDMISVPQIKHSLCKIASSIT